MILHIMDQVKDVDYRVATASSNASNKVHSVCMGGYPAIARFPVVVQKLLIPEILAVEERIAEGKDAPLSAIALSRAAICCLVDISLV